MQAILITAYKNQLQLERLIHSFDDRFNIYVHIDKKSKISPSFCNQKNVYIIKKYSIGWGTINHLKAILDLLSLAISNDDNKFVHIISGQDIRVKELKDFQKFENDKKIYMDCQDVSDLPKQIKNRYQNGTISSNFRQNSHLVRAANILYGLTHKKKKKIGEFNYIYKGLIWMSFPAEVAKYLIRYIKDNKFVNSLRHIIIPEEFVFQTILMNSKYRNKIVNNNLRYDDWSRKRNGSLPATLDINDFNKVITGRYFFARKIDPIISNDLVKAVSKYLHS